MWFGVLLHAVLRVLALVFLLLGATAGFRLALYFIFIDPCAGRHLLLLLRQKK
jgi:hypothetical protein